MKNYIVIKEESYKKLKKELKFYKKKTKRLNNILNKDLDEFNDELNTFIFLEKKDFEEHTIHYYELNCLVGYLKQLKRRLNNEK